MIEIVGSPTLGQILGRASVAHSTACVLVGGYGGTWVGTSSAWFAPHTARGLEPFGADLGSGLLAVLPVDACVIAETAHLVRYLTSESAGQCGPCTLGLPAIRSLVDQLARGQLRRRSVSHFERLAEAIEGRGACRHPDGVVRLVRSMFKAAGDDVTDHLQRRPCRGSTRPSVFPIPMVRTTFGVAVVMRIKIDATRCEGHGICVLFLGELLELDHWGFVFVENSQLETQRLVRHRAKSRNGVPERRVGRHVRST